MTEVEELAAAFMQAAESTPVSDAEDYAILAAESLIEVISGSDLSVGEVLLAAVTRLPAEMVAPSSRFQRRNAMAYELHDRLSVDDLTFVNDVQIRNEFALTADSVADTVREINAALMALELFGSVLRVSIGELLQLRQLSSLVSSIVASELNRQLGSKTFLNPHQDGYPDLIANTKDAIKYRKDITAANRMSDKSAWTSPSFGGIEVKATVGNTLPARVHPKPAVGEERSELIVSFDWKAHHRETNNLFSVIWDFVDTVPTVSSVFFRNDLVSGDWGNVVVPSVGGGRTTSVSVMKQSGVQKMAKGWILRSKDEALRQGLRRGKVLIIADPNIC
jgi:hypothetical protein